MTLGVSLPVTGDDNYNAKVTVRYHSSSSSTWRDALPLYRVHPETIFAYSINAQFSGSIFDLRPSTTYTIELHVTDPDGPVDQTFTLTATTRSVPGGPANPRSRAVSNTAELQAALNSAVAGDVITLANGTYPGKFSLSNSGTAVNPIVIRGASRDGVILDGGNCGCNVVDVYGSYTHWENLTVRSGTRGISFSLNGLTGNVVRGAHIIDTTLGITSGNGSQDYYIADNILEGRLAWPLVYTSDDGAHSDDDGIRMSGFGMVVAHNRISGYGDAIGTNQTGARAFDVYGNDVLWSYDNCLEFDTSEGNVRALRNRFTNCSSPFSMQPVYAGPAYILRNVVTNAVDEQLKFHALNIASPPPQPNGVYVYQNTFASAENELQVRTPFASYHTVLENNLFIASSPLGAYPVNWDAPLYDAVFNYNGYYPDGHFLFRWGQTYANYNNFAEMQAAGVEKNGALMAPGLFASGYTPTANWWVLKPPPDVALAGSSTALNRGLVLPNINDAFTGSAPDLGALEFGCPAPVYGPRATGVDESNEPLGCEAGASAPPPVLPTGTAAFVKTDIATQGNWKSAYGKDGAIVIGDSQTLPSYVSVTPANKLDFLWNGSTGDVRAPFKLASTTDRIAACWYSPTGFTVALNFTDGQTHQVALYAMDWDNYYGRKETIDIIDANGQLLDSRPLTGFFGGQYLVWNLSGRVTIRVTNTNAPSNAVIEGLFFGAGGVPAPVVATGTAAFLTKDTATQGNWKSAYGKDGSLVIGDSQSLPSYVSVTPANKLDYLWNPSTSDGRALSKAASTTDRIASCWYSPAGFTVALNFTDGQAHQVALYAMDWDNYNGRAETIDIIDANGLLLDSRPLAGFIGGQYLVWNLSGRVSIRVTNTNASSNAVIEGLFFGVGGVATNAPATGFLKVDATTRGNWQNVYGSQGAIVVADSSVLPSFATVTSSGNSTYIWDSNPSDGRALSRRGSSARIASCWYSGTSFTIGVNLSDGQPHQIALYAVDYDNYLSRTQTITVLDASGNVIDTRSLANFTGGQYLVWKLSGNVTFRITNTNSNAVIGGLFID